MRLDSVELVGFKSFAQKTTIHFSRGLTEIVGPNGSGKSNVIEAIRWALGEQSSKNLRSSKMTDVIFSGSKSRQALDRAKVTLVFDNRDHFIKNSYNQIKVSRKLYRSGDSYYYLNGKECRLRDVQELFMNSGIGNGSFSVISQGNVEQIFRSKPEDRRFIIETAAGIYRYKFQKRLAQQKLNQTNSNLARIDDLVRELKNRLVSLKRQAQVAQRFLTLRRSFRQLSALRLGLKSATAKRLANQQRQRASQCRTQILKVNREVTKLRKQSVQVNVRLNRLNQRNQTLQDRRLKMSRQFERANGRLKLRWQKLNFLRQRDRVDQGQLNRLRKQKQKLAAKRLQLEPRFTAQGQVVKKLTKRINGNSKRPSNRLSVDPTQSQLSKHRANYVKLIQQLSRLQDQIDNYSKNRNRVSSRIKAIKQRLLSNQHTVQVVAQKLKSVQISVRKLKSRDNGRVIINRRTDQVRRVAQDFNSLSRRYRFVVNRFQLNRARFRGLDRILANHSNLYRGNRNLLNHANSIGGVWGPVVKFLKVPDRYVRAIEVALRSQLQQIIVDNTHVAQIAIRYLTQHRLGRVTLLPVDGVRPRFLKPVVVNKCNSVAGFIDVAVNLVRMPSRFLRIKKYLLGSTLVSRNLKSAVQLSSVVYHHYRVVTLNGEVVNTGGSVSGGRGRYRNHGLLDQKNELSRLSKAVKRDRVQIYKLKPLIVKKRKRLDAAQNDLNQLRARQNRFQQKLKLDQVEASSYQSELKQDRKSGLAIHSTLDDLRSTSGSVDLGRLKQLAKRNRRKLNQQRAKIERDQTRLKVGQQAQQRHQSHFQQQRETLIKARVRLDKLKRLDGQLTTQLNSSHQRALKIVSDIQSCRRSIRATSQVKAQRVPKRYQRQLTNLKSTFSQNQRVRSRWRKSLKQINRRKNNFQRRGLKLQQQLDRHHVKLQQFRYYSERLHQFRRVHNYSKVTPNQHASLSQVDSHLTQLRQQLAKFTSVNTASLTQLKAVNHRYRFLDQQLADLTESKARLLKTMNRVNFDLRHRFKVTFDQVNQAFKRTFTQIFQGGQAHLALTDPHHLLTTGIEIMAQPPGKRYRNLALLSGGERSLTAIALLFAVLKVKPVPFCILDEAESALDAINVSRFARYMKRLDHQTQFIVITHRKTTMLYADHLYGITMQNSGVSKVIAVDLEKAKKGDMNGII